MQETNTTGIQIGKEEIKLSLFTDYMISSVQLLSRLVRSDSLWPHGLQYTRLPCPLPTPGAWSNSWPSSQWPSNHLILCHPLLLLPSISPSIRVFSNESILRIRWPKYWRFSFSISPSNEYSGLLTFRVDWFDLLAPRNSQESSPTPHTVQKHQFFGTQPSSQSNSHIH